MTRVKFEDFDTTTRSRDMLVAARVVCKAPLRITQGGYNAGAVPASAGTHDRDALDIRAKDLSDAERKEAVSILRKVGFAAWLRSPAQASKAKPWPWHIHCIPIGGDLSAGAAAQVEDYKNNKNGLASHGRDDGPRTWVDWTWERYKKTYPNLLTEDNMANWTEDQLRKIVREENEKYGVRLWALSTGTGQGLIKAVASLTGMVSALAKQVSSEDVADDAEFKAAMARLDATLADLKKSVEEPAPKA